MTRHKWYEVAEPENDKRGRIVKKSKSKWSDFSKALKQKNMMRLGLVMLAFTSDHFMSSYIL